MAETVSDSDSDLELSLPAKPQPKRRRLINPSSVATVSIYKVNSSLQFKPTSFTQDGPVGGNTDVDLWFEPLPLEKRKPSTITLTDSEEEEEKEELHKSTPIIEIRSPSPPPPPGSPTVKISKRAKRLLEINRRLGAVGSPSQKSKGVIVPQEHCDMLDDSDDHDIIIMSPSKTRPKSKPSTSEESPQTSREFPLKFRCRTDLYKIPVLSTAPLSTAVDQLSVKLSVPPSHILLLRRDVELPVHSTAKELGLGIADIIDCVITGADKLDPEDSGDMITLRLQGKENRSGQEYSLHKDAPLGSILSQYLSSFGTDTRRKVRFRFDGSEIKNHQTPSQMDMEDGDVIEVWT